MESSCAECPIDAELVTVCWLPNKNEPKERQHQNYLKGFLHKCLHVEGIVHAMDFSVIYMLTILTTDPVGETNKFISTRFQFFSGGKFEHTHVHTNNRLTNLIPDIFRCI